MRRRGHGPHDAQDLFQSFFSFLLATRGGARTDPNLDEELRQLCHVLTGAC